LVHLAIWNVTFLLHSGRLSHGEPTRLIQSDPDRREQYWCEEGSTSQSGDESVHGSAGRPRGRDGWLRAGLRACETRRAGKSVVLLSALLFLPPVSLQSQGNSPAFGRKAERGGEHSETEPSAYRIQRFTRASFFLSASSLGIGGQISTNVSPHLDVRLFGNRASITTHHWSQEDFSIAVNAGFANVGAMGDAYPFHKPFRLSAGYLVYNGDRVRADLHAKQDAIFTINDIDWSSNNADPVHGTGRLSLGGNGFLLTAGYGRMVSRTEKHVSFPFEAGVAFIDRPTVTLSLEGQICSSQGTNCQPAASYPGFADALMKQLATWNGNASPFHIYPIVQGGVAYTFRIR
jgi:hypothetical protein